MEERRITKQALEAYEETLRSEEKSDHTVEKYMRDVRCFQCFAEERQIIQAKVPNNLPLIHSLPYKRKTRISKMRELCSYFSQSYPIQEGIVSPTSTIHSITKSRILQGVFTKMCEFFST